MEANRARETASASRITAFPPLFRIATSYALTIPRTEDSYIVANICKKKCLLFLTSQAELKFSDEGCGAISCNRANKGRSVVARLATTAPN
jgi:hypothetical protein